MTFSHSETLGQQSLLACNPEALLSDCGSGTQPLFEGDAAATCEVTHVGDPETDATKGYFEVRACVRACVCVQVLRCWVRRLIG